MSISVEITPTTPIQQVNITTTASSPAITPVSASSDFMIPSPNNLYEYTAAALPSPTDVVSATAIASLSSVGVAAGLQVNVGVAASSSFQNEMQGFKSLFKSFNNSPANFTHGQTCYFKTANSVAYNCNLQAVNVADDAYGQSQLFIFLAFANTNLYVMRKGYFDYPTNSTLIENWVPGRTLYIASNNKLTTAPVFSSGAYVRSVGFCVPNTDGVYRVWFESDNTFVKKS